MSKFVYVLVFLYLCYRAVYGAKDDKGSVQVESVNYGADGNYLRAGVRKTISCKGSIKNQKVDWYDPNGNPVSLQPSSRVYAQQHLVPMPRAKARSLALVLIFTRAAVEDSGVWECRSGNLKEEVSLCVLDPPEFVNTVTEVTVSRGRSFTLSCEARGEPEPRLLWTRNGYLISDDDNSTTKYKVMTKFNSQGFEGLLTIISVEPEDAGVYSCTALQEIPFVDDCSTTKTLNITLEVNYGPTFDSENDKIEHVYGRINESVNLVCAAGGFPVPTYRWFHDLDGDVLTEYPEKDIILSEDGSQATLPLVANASTFGEKYMCRATNPFGDSKKYFTVLKLENPRRPTAIIVSNSTSNEIEFNVTWTDEVLFPVDSFDIQFLVKKLGTGTPKDWRRAIERNLELEQRVVSSEETYITLSDLEQATEYWVRLRARNEAGESQWSAPILANTIMQPDPETTQESTTESTEESTLKVMTEEPKSDGLFYGLFFTGGIIIVAVVSMFVVRMV